MRTIICRRFSKKSVPIAWKKLVERVTCRKKTVVPGDGISGGTHGLGGKREYCSLSAKMWDAG